MGQMSDVARRQWPGLCAQAAAFALAACAAAPQPAPAGPAALFNILDRFADARRLTPAAVGQAFNTGPSGRSAEPVIFQNGAAGGLRLDSLELYRSDDEIELDLFPGADCIARAEVEGALGPGAVRTALSSDTGFQLSWTRPAVASSQWPATTYTLSVAFAGAGRCATQVTLRHERASL